jgi:hypothetical protein
MTGAHSRWASDEAGDGSAVDAELDLDVRLVLAMPPSPGSFSAPPSDTPTHACFARQT